MDPFDGTHKDAAFCDVCKRYYRVTTGHTCTPVTELEENRWLLEAWLGSGFTILHEGSN